MDGLEIDHTDVAKLKEILGSYIRGEETVPESVSSDPLWRSFKQLTSLVRWDCPTVTKAVIALLKNKPEIYYSLV